MSSSLLDFEPSHNVLCSRIRYGWSYAACSPNYSPILVSQLYNSTFVSALDHLLSACFIFFPPVCATVVANLRSTGVFWINDFFSNTSSVMISMTHVSSSSALFDDAKLCEDSNDLKRAQSSRVHSFLVGLLIRQTFYHISRTLCLIYFFGTSLFPTP